MKTNNQLLTIYAYYLRKTYPFNAGWTDKKLANGLIDVIRTENGAIVPIEKLSRLETNFWIGEGYCAGRTFNEAQDLCRQIRKNKADYFIEKNTDNITRAIEKLDRYIVFLRGETSGICCADIFYTVDCYREEYQKNNPIHSILCGLEPKTKESLRAEELTLKDALTYKDVLLRSKKDIIKRCNAYLKRYGSDKIQIRTYWADR